MAKIIIGNKNIGGLLRVGEDVEVCEYQLVDDKYVARGGGKTVGYIRHIPEYSGGGDGGEYFEIEIPSWDYPETSLMLKVKEKKPSA